MTSTLLFATGIVAFVIILALFLTFIHNRQNKKQLEKQNQYFSRAADAFGITVHKKNLHRHRIIGCDEHEKRVIFVDYSKQPYSHTLIVLKDVAGSKIIINHSSLTEKIQGIQKITEKFISSVQLCIQFKNNTIAPVILPVYENYIDSWHDLEHLKKDAENWNKLINENCG